jgi:hypothetical protein
MARVRRRGTPVLDWELRKEVFLFRKKKLLRLSAWDVGLLRANCALFAAGLGAHPTTSGRPNPR